MAAKTVGLERSLLTFTLIPKPICHLRSNLLTRDRRTGIQNFVVTVGDRPGSESAQRKQGIIFVIIRYKTSSHPDFMSNPVLHAFFLGRALAEVLTEKVEENLTNALSELGKFDAEQRENLRQLIEEVQARASQERKEGSDLIATLDGPVSSDDLQETLDKLRAEIASLKAELKIYRENNP